VKEDLNPSGIGFPAIATTTISSRMAGSVLSRKDCEDMTPGSDRFPWALKNRSDAHGRPPPISAAGR
jgi:hypothetical protein